MLLQDKVVVVSGIGPGLGRSIALRCARQGADIVLAARTESRLAEVAKEVTGLGRRAVTVPADIASEQDAVRLAETAMESFGRVDTLVNNAFAVPPMGDLDGVPFDGIRQGFETNVLGALRLTNLFRPMLEASRGSIVMVSSMVIRHSKPAFGPYKMTKSALLSMAQSLSTELGPKGVRVNTIAPGYIWAGNVKYYFDYLAKQRGISPQEVYDEVAAGIDLRKLPEPDEVADTIVFLASDLARAVTGQCLDVNGGEYHH
ncbi:SDR family oxidoreductase [Kibdelosporangium phytohabitans]|uniref:Short-chain dehydrogenase n=1 Tax=Kibdelosporangium phytohabitans TaxID=860235 RepID=A0A0N9ICF7_9PSEU|nr:SDR family oxidoreductase [Kibdelosporangium phytohabitans]ALG12276.1 short-chain dehydrogenase [Kibdelosporangium phytohabitans]MBE1463829.1 NAD(P)-dependent dehydrogenase (short-subunit alcohol dehydrogenase family) [Kibdelosporangium phytohabitans]